ncbi:MAG TPA: hypothetical protein VG476_05305, partial [Acidimicrobiales bacterium]|nr:hypothetical protein [Acidimicrobiales bacterium]
MDRTEDRMARAMGYVRLAMLPLVAVPLLGRPRRRVLASALMIAAAAETSWVLKRIRRQRTLRDRVLIWVDVGFCAVFNLLVAHIDPAERRRVRYAVVSYSLASAGFVGFGFGGSAEGTAAVGALVGTWASPSPARDMRLVSELLAHVLWYATTIFGGREFRTLAKQIADAQAETARLQAESAERAREADVAREREITHREIHEHLLP